MPRQLLARRYQERIKERLRRARNGSVAVGRSVRGPGFNDYFPNVPGTELEKRVFNALANMGVSFIFQPYLGDIPFSEQEERYRPDFLLPEYNIIIEPVGTYWHSRPDSYMKDAQRAAMLLAAGYTLYNLSDIEVMENAEQAIREAIPELASPMFTTHQIRVTDRASTGNPLASRILKRAKIPNIQVKLGTRKKRTGAVTLQKGGRPSSVKPVFGAMFDPTDFPDSYVAVLRAYGLAWKSYVDSLGEFFTAYAEAIEFYPTEYAYWQRWRSWWTRFSSF